MDLHPGQNGQSSQGDGISLSSSPEIISVDEMPSNQRPNAVGSQSDSMARDRSEPATSESSESNSAEMVDIAASNSGGSGEEDTDWKLMTLRS